ncbi:hypothetical protein KIH27_04510 [Mycobacterium sp. M1]|uniref:Predicted hydrolase N-terminal domain-containing protein n=1 Tax=Mycolicibacter acidiphilus TaxID=2835306 RepID=A0ABS5RF02_9MYCO|nr:hypothetical protein [Mycolicibacter acidiphilus]
MALQLENVATALATAQRSCDAEIAVVDNGLHELDDAIGAAEANDEDAQELRDGAVAMVGVALGDVQATRDGYAATMATAQASIEAVQTAGNAGADGGAGVLGSPGENSARGAEGDGGAGGLGLPGTVPAPTGSPKKDTTRRDVILGSAGAITGGTADGVGKAVEKVLAEGPKTGPGAPSPTLTKFLQDPTIRGVELKGLSRLGRVAGAAGAIPAVFTDHADGNSWSEAVFRESAGTGIGLYAGAATGGFVADMLAAGAIGSVVPGAGTAVGLVVGAGVGAFAAFKGSAIAGDVWEWTADNVVGGAIRGLKSVFGSG